MFSFGPRKTVAEVMATFHRTLSELEVVEQQHADEAGSQRSIANEAIKSAELCEQEAKLARSVAMKLRALIGTEGDYVMEGA